MTEKSIENFIANELKDCYRHITVFIKNNKKCTTGDHKNYTLEQIKNDKGNVNKYTHYSLAIKLANIICIDIDEVDYDYSLLPSFFSTLPYTLGNTKGRHYYCKLDNKPNWSGTENKVFNNFEGDLIGIQQSSNNIWEKKNGIIYNYNNSIPNVSFYSKILPMLIPSVQIKYISKSSTLVFDDDDDITTIEPNEPQSIVDTKVVTPVKDVIYDIIDGLNESRSSEFTSWLNIGYILHNSDYPIEVFDYFSKKDKKYPGYSTIEQFYSKLIKKKDDDNKLTLNTLWAYLKEDNPELYSKLSTCERNGTTITFLPQEKYNYLTLVKYFTEDINFYGDSHFKLYENSKAYQYFNHFHVWHNKLQSIFLVNPDAAPDMYEKGNLYPNLFVTSIVDKKTKKMLFSKLWLTSLKRNTTDEFIFNPNPNFINKTNNINLFTDFEHKSFITDNFIYDETLITPYIEHIKHLCKNEVNVYNYLLNWISHLFQKPHKKTTVAILLYSRTQGVGKNIAFDIIQKLLKKYYLKVSNTNNLVDKFNSYQQNKILAVCDEINARTRDIADELKDIITRNELKIEYKGKNSYFIDDYCNYVFTTNNENVIKIDNSDRRMMIIQTPEVKLSKEHIDTLVNILEDDVKLTNLFYYFYTRDISAFIPQKLVTTSYKKILIMNDLPAYIKMFRLNPEDFAGNSFTPTELYKKSLEYAKSNNISKCYTDRIAYKTFKSLFSDFYIVKYKHRSYDFPDDFSDNIKSIINKFISL